MRIIIKFLSFVLILFSFIHCSRHKTYEERDAILNRYIAEDRSESQIIIPRGNTDNNISQSPSIEKAETISTDFSEIKTKKVSFEREQYILYRHIFDDDNFGEYQEEIENDFVRNIEKTKSELDKNWYSPFEMIGWSRNGLFAYRKGHWVDAMPGWSYSLIIINTITDEIIEKDEIYIHGLDEVDMDSINTVKNKWNALLERHHITGRVENPYSDNFNTNLLIFPIDNFSCWFDYTITITDSWAYDNSIEWQIKIGNNVVQKVIGDTSEGIDILEGRKILGYYMSPYENRIVVITNYYFTYFGPGCGLDIFGCNMDVGLSP